MTLSISSLLFDQDHRFLLDRLKHPQAMDQKFTSETQKNWHILQRFKQSIGLNPMSRAGYNKTWGLSNNKHPVMGIKDVMLLLHPMTAHHLFDTL